MRIVPRKSILIALGIALSAWSGSSQFAEAQLRDSGVPEAAKELAPRIAQVLRAEQDKKGKVLEVAIFAFGNEEGKVSEGMFQTSKVIQGELATQLRNNSNRKFIVWDPFRTRVQVEKSKSSTELLSVKRWKEAAALLAKLGLDAAVVGSFQTDGKEVAWEGVNVHADILFADGPPLQVASKGKVVPDDDVIVPTETPSMISTRFSVDILVDGVPLKIDAQQEGYHTGNLYLDLDREKHFGKPFTIRLKNHGLPSVGWITKTRGLERARFFCAAAYVDGVNSFYEREADGDFHPSQRHPNNATKWVLAAPGVVVDPGYDTLRNLHAQHNVRGAGHSVVHIKGYQQDGETAARFEFADAGESLAHEAGLTKDIGVISVYFYSEKSPDDVNRFPPGLAGAGAGVRLGELIPQEVFRVRVHTHEKPVEVWNIYYRYSDSKDSVKNRKEDGETIAPIATAITDMEGRFRKEANNFGAEFDRRGNRNRSFTNAGPNLGNPGPGGRLGGPAPGRRVGAARPR